MSNNIIKVSLLNNYLKRYIDANDKIKDLFVEGEISNFTRSSKGHIYFKLKDDNCEIPCVMYKYNQKHSINFTDGDLVVVKSYVSFYPEGGRLQLFIRDIQMSGVGKLLKELEELKTKMAKDGYFDQNHKILGPDFPLNVAVVVGKDSAAYSDIKRCFEIRWPIAKVDYFFTLVQGNEAAKQIISTLKRIDELDYDTIILARGGGSIEDLWCFNDFGLAVTIYNLKTFIITGIGHEQDFTIADMVADLRASTPTGAVESSTPTIDQVLTKINHYQSSITKIKNHILNNHLLMLDRYNLMLKQFDDNLVIKKHELVILNNKLLYNVNVVYQKYLNELNYCNDYLNRFDFYIKEKHKDIVNTKSLFKTLIRNIIKNNIDVNKNYNNLINKDLKNIVNNKLLYYKRLNILLDAYNPNNILNKGYSLVYKDDILIDTIDKIKPLEDIHIKLIDGEILTTVKEVKKHG